MISAGEVGAVFAIVDEASPVLRLLIEQFERLDALIGRTKEQLSTLRLPTGAARAIAEMDASLAKLPASTDKAVASMATGFGRLDGIIGGAKLQVGELSAEVKAAGEQMATIGRVPASLTRAGRLAGDFDKVGPAAETAAGAVEAALGKMDSALRVTQARVVELAGDMKGVGAGLATAGRGMGAAEAGMHARGGGAGGGGHGGGFHVSGPGMELPGGSHIRPTSTSDGFLELMGGAALAEMTKKFVESRMELDTLVSHAKAAGYTNQQQAEIMGAAWENAGKTVNTTAVESYKNILELAQVTGSYGEAIKMLPSFTAANAALASLKESDLRATVGGKSQTYDFARSLELLGVTQDDAKLATMTTAITREIIGMRGLIDGSKLFQGIQNAGGARYAWNEDFVGHVLGPLLQASPRAGAGLYQLDRSFGSGVTTQMMARGAEKYGFWSKEDEAYDDARHKRFKGMKTGSIAGYDLLRSNPEQWATDVAIPLMKAHGVDVDDTNAMGKAINEISRGNKNLNVILDELLLPGPRAQLAKERANIDKVPADAGGVLMKDDPALKMAALRDKWSDLMTALGGPLIDKAMSAVTNLTSGLNTLAQFLNAHPIAAKLTADLTSIAGGLLLLSGSMKMGKFFFGDLFGADTKLSASALALDGSAQALTLAAEKLGMGGMAGIPKGGVIPEVPKTGIVPETPGVPFSEMIGKSLKGGLWGAIALYFGETLIKDMFPLTPEQQKIKDMSVVDRFKQLGKDLGLPDFVPAKGAALAPLSPKGAYGAGWSTPSGMAYSTPEMDREAARGRALGALPKLSAEIVGSLMKLPGDVNPAVNAAFASISTSITAAIASMAASARQAAAAIPIGSPGAPTVVHTAVHLDGRTVAQNTTYHQLRETRTASSTGRFDGSLDPSPVDYGFT